MIPHLIPAWHVFPSANIICEGPGEVLIESDVDARIALLAQFKSWQLSDHIVYNPTYRYT